MDLTNVYIGFALATLAGLSTGIGSMLGLYSKFENKTSGWPRMIEDHTV